MGLAETIRGAAGIPGLRVLCAAYDFDAEGLDNRARLERLNYAVRQAWNAACHVCERDELEFALSECRDLQRLLASGPESAVLEPARVVQRMKRIRRVLLHYEGRVSRLNRLYWWVPFVGLLAAMVVCCVRPLLGL